MAQGYPTATVYPTATAPVQKKFIQLIDEYGIRFSVPRECVFFYRDDGEFRLIRYQDWAKHSNTVVEMKVKTTYEDLVRELS